MKLNALTKWLAVLFVFTGCFLAINQYFYNRSLWLDEASLALNILERGPAGLLQPLNYGQVAPILFLQLTNAATALLGEYEFGLRFIPLLAYLSSLTLFYLILRKVVRDPLALLAGLSLFVFNQFLIYYSSEFKQYMTDVFVALLLVFLTIDEELPDRRRYVLFTLAGMVSIFLSNITIIIFTMIFPMLLLKAWQRRDRKHFQWILGSGVFLLSIFIVYYFLFIQGHPLRAYMLNYWSKAGGFIPSDLTQFATYSYLKGELWNLFTYLGFQGYLFWDPLKHVSVLFGFALVVVFLWQSIRKRSPLAFLIMPFVIHYTLSYFKLYPNSIRLILYLFPLIMIMVTLGLERVLIGLRRIKWAGEGLVFLLVVTTGVAMFAKKVPMGREEIKRTIDHVQAKIRPGDSVYLYFGATTAFTYYQRMGYVKMNNPVVHGPEPGDHREKLIQDIVTRRGNQWIIFSHIEKDDDKYILNGLGRYGYSNNGSFRTTGSAAYYCSLR